jgi:hypothetical protein
MAGKTDREHIEEHRKNNSHSYDESAHEYGIQAAKEIPSPAHTETRTYANNA